MPDAPKAYAYLVEALEEAYDKCFCPTDVTLRAVWEESSDLIVSSEWSRSLALLLDSFKSYRVGSIPLGDGNGI